MEDLAFPGSHAFSYICSEPDIYAFPEAFQSILNESSPLLRGATEGGGRGMGLAYPGSHASSYNFQTPIL